MNIVEVYNKYNKQLIILVSGLSGSGKTKLADNLKNLMHIKLVNAERYYKKENTNVVTLTNGMKVTDWDHIDTYDWKTINEEVNKMKSEGVILCGAYLPTNKLDFKPDFHLHIKISKQKLIEKRHEFMKTHPDKYDGFDKILDTPTEQLMINQITYPHYLDYLKESKIDKWLNANELSDDEIYDQAFNYLMYAINEYIKLNSNEINMFLKGTSSKVVEQVVSGSVKKVGTTRLKLKDSSSDDLSDTPIYLGTTAY